MRQIKLRGRNPYSIQLDDDIFMRASLHYWYLTGRGNKSIKTYIWGISKSLNNFIMGDPPLGFVWDHIDRDIYNNQKSNFRLASIRQNAINGERPLGVSGFRGVTYSLKRDCWEAKIRLKNKRKYLGVFSTAEAAARVYDIWAIKYHKEFAVLNFPEEK